MLRNEKMGARIVLRGLEVGLRLWGLGLNSLGLRAWDLKRRVFGASWKVRVNDPRCIVPLK